MSLSFRPGRVVSKQEQAAAFTKRRDRGKIEKRKFIGWIWISICGKCEYRIMVIPQLSPPAMA